MRKTPDFNKLAVLQNRRLTIFKQLVEERQRQDAKFGYERDYPDGTGGGGDIEMCRQLRIVCDRRTRNEQLEWRDILLEELYEVLSETDPEKLRKELVQVGAVVMNWLEALQVRL